MYRCSEETYSLGNLPEVALSGELKGLAITLTLANSLGADSFCFERTELYIKL